MTASPTAPHNVGAMAEFAGSGPERPPVANLGRDDFDRDVWCILGMPLDAASLAGAAAEVRAAAIAGRRLSFVTPNVNWLVRLLRDPGARRRVINSDYALADGAPLAAAARLLGAPIKERVAGADLFEALRGEPAPPGRRLRVFFFGGREGSARAAHDALNAHPDGVEAVGWLNPGFGDVDAMSANATIDEINAARPDFVLVALGAEKGQDWIERNRDRLSAPILAHLGAVVDFTGGAVRRAPRWLAKAGFEWLWRIFQEPSLWRRYAGDGLVFAGIAFMRLVPQLAAGRVQEPAQCRAFVRDNGEATVVKIDGVPAHGGLQPVRRAFRAAVAARPNRVVLDLSAAECADRAFLGLVLMLEKHLAAGNLWVAGASPKMRRLFELNAMNYPECAVMPGPVQDQTETARAAAV